MRPVTTVKIQNNRQPAASNKVCSRLTARENTGFFFLGGFRLPSVRSFVKQTRINAEPAAARSPRKSCTQAPSR